MHFDDPLSMAATIMGLVDKPRAARSAHLHNADCPRDCLGFYLSIDLIGDGVDEPLDDFALLTIPPALQTLVCAFEPQALVDTAAAQAAFRAAWAWHGKPQSFIYHHRVVLIDGGPPTVYSVIVDHEMDYTDTGPGSLADAICDLRWPDAAIERTVYAARKMCEACWNHPLAWSMTLNVTDELFNQLKAEDN